MKTQTTQERKETALDRAKRGLLITDVASRDKILSKQVGMLPAAFMSEADHCTGDAMVNHFFRAKTRLKSKHCGNGVGFFAIGMDVSQDLTHITHGCHPH